MNVLCYCRVQKLTTFLPPVGAEAISLCCKALTNLLLCCRLHESSELMVLTILTWFHHWLAVFRSSVCGTSWIHGGNKLIMYWHHDDPDEAHSIVQAYCCNIVVQDGFYDSFGLQSENKCEQNEEPSQPSISLSPVGEELSSGPFMPPRGRMKGFRVGAGMIEHFLLCCSISHSQ